MLFYQVNSSSFLLRDAVMRAVHHPTFQACYQSAPMVNPMGCILEIIRSSERNNSKLKLSGMLYFGEITYLQMIDGEKTHVETIMEKIRNDTRHKILWEVQRIVPKRSFSTELPMGFLDDVDARKSSVSEEASSFRNHCVESQVEMAVGFLVAVGKGKYPSMSC
jgi:hypothetical protein